MTDVSERPPPPPIGEEAEIVEELMETHIRPFLGNGRVVHDDSRGFFG